MGQELDICKHVMSRCSDAAMVLSDSEQAADIVLSANILFIDLCAD